MRPVISAPPWPCRRPTSTERPSIFANRSMASPRWSSSNSATIPSVAPSMPSPIESPPQQDQVSHVGGQWLCALLRYRLAVRNPKPLSSVAPVIPSSGPHRLGSAGEANPPEGPPKVDSSPPPIEELRLVSKRGRKPKLLPCRHQQRAGRPASLIGSKSSTPSDYALSNLERSRLRQQGRGVPGLG